jgi:hypothetical protein
MKRLSIWLMLSLAAALLVAGCGSSSSSSNGQSTSTTASTSAATTATASTPKTTPAPTTSTGKPTPATSGISKSAIRKLTEGSCKKQIQADLALTSVEKSSIEKLCPKAAEHLGKPNGVAQQVCTELIKHSALPGTPDTPARKQALEACKSSK